MKKLIFAFLLMAAVDAAAQNTKITTIQIKPADLQRIVAAKNTRRVVSMPNAEKLKKVKILLQAKVEPAKLNSMKLDTPVSLNVRNSFVDDKVILMFDSPNTISPYENSADFEPSDAANPSKLRVLFNAPTNGFYVFDFFVEKAPGGNVKNQSMRFSTMTFGSVSQPFEAGQQQHQIFVLPVNQAGWTMVSLDSENSGWKFIALEIAKAL